MVTKRNQSWICVCLVILLAWGILQGQTKGSLTGVIVDEKTGEPVQGANALLLGTMIGAASDEEGYLEITNIPPSVYTLLVTAIGFEKSEEVIQILPGKTAHVEITLSETVLYMDGVAVTASRYKQALGDIPVSLSLLPAQALKERNITSVDQALRYVPGVNATDGGQVSIRGSSGFNWGVGSRVLVLLNGNPFMAGDLWNVNWYAIPTSNIRQIEIMKGSGSALYGSSAMGGVINIITEHPGEGAHFHVRSFSGFYNEPSFPEWRWTDSRQHFEGTAIDFSTRIGPLAATLSSNYQNTTGYKENDDHQVLNFMANIAFPLSEKLRLDIMSGYGRNEGGFFIYWQNLKHPYDNGSDPSGYETRSTMNNTFVFPVLSYVLNNQIFVTVKGKVNHTYTEDWLLSGTGVLADSAFRSSKVRSDGGEIQLNWQTHARGILVAGCDLNKDAVESVQFSHTRVFRAAYYMQYEQRFRNRLKATLGLRYDWEKTHEQGANGDLSRKLGLNYSLSPLTSLRFSIGEGFRIPTVGERFIKTKTSGIWILENPSLQPEKSLSTELGIQSQLTPSVHFDMSGFYTRYDNLIEPQLDRNAENRIVVRFQNIVNARIQGLEVSLRKDWYSKLVSTQVGYTLLDTKNLSKGSMEYGLPLKYRSKHTLYTTTNIYMPPFQIGFDFRYLSRIERVDTYHKTYIADIDQVVPAYVCSARLGVERGHFTFRVVVDNIFQYNYILSPANMAPPRTIILQLTADY